MSGIYGDMLLAWPEQNRVLEVYDMKPKQNGGWDKVVDQSGNLITQTIIGVFQNTRGGGVKDNNGNLVETEGRELWTQTGGLNGKFLTWNGDVFRLTVPDGSDWSFEGGFYRYGVEKVVGNNGTESDNATWNIGGGSFG